MWITFDFEFTEGGERVGHHMVDTSDPEVHKTLRGLANGDIDHDNAGWSVISKHPNYIGFTRFEVLKAEVIRLNDEDGRSVLGL